MDHHIKFNASGIPKSLTKAHGTRHVLRVFFSTQNEEIENRKALRQRNMTQRRERFEKRSRSDPEYVKSLDMKECMLEVQGMLIGKLAAQENHFKGLAIVLGFDVVDFEERVKEVEEVIQALQY